MDCIYCCQVVGDDAARARSFASLLSHALAHAEDVTVLNVAAQTLGHLVRSGGAMAADIVDKEVRTCTPSQVR